MYKLLSVLVFTTHVSFSQYLHNPSFEDTPGTSRSPVGWYPCNEYSTPDTQPGAWNVWTEASNGSTYISLVTRGLNGLESDNRKEAIGTALKIPFNAEVTYRVSLDLAHSQTFDDFLDLLPWHPVVLEVYAGNSECDMSNLIWVSPKISHPGWSRYEIEFTPAQVYRYFLLQANYATADTHNGNILIDNVTIEDPAYSEPIDDSPMISRACKLRIPNVITPNADRLNDGFLIAYETNVARYRISIYNRWGRPIFETTDINEVWYGETNNGNEAPAGVYYWSIHCLCIDNNTILEDNLKGSVSLVR